MRLSLFILFSCLTSFAYAMQFGRQECPISVGMGNCTTCIFSPYIGNNPALSATNAHPSVQTYVKNTGLLPQIGTYNIAMNYPFSFLNIGINASFHGFDAYHELSFTCCLAKFFKPYIAIALEGEYCCLYNSPKSGYFHSGLLSVGMMVFPIKNMRIGVSIYNVSFSPFTINEQNFRLPVIFKVGLSYHIAKKIMLTAEVQKSLDQPFAFCIGVDYQVISMLNIRTGLFAQRELTPSLGLGFTWKHFQIDMGVQYHLSLGCNLSAGFLYKW